MAILSVFGSYLFGNFRQDIYDIDRIFSLSAAAAFQLYPNAWPWMTPNSYFTLNSGYRVCVKWNNPCIAYCWSCDLPVHIDTCLSLQRAIWLVLSSTYHFLTDDSLQSADKDQQESRTVAGKPHVGLPCRCKIRYVSKWTAASRCSPCESTAFLLLYECMVVAW